MNLAILVTLSRVVAIPVVLLLWREGQAGASLVLLAVAFATDYIDGKLARGLGKVTVAGAILDPVADKANVLAYYSYLYALGTLPGWLFVPTVARNLAQLSAIPVLSGWLRIPFNVKPKRMPKWATATSFGLAFAGFCLAGGAPLWARELFLIVAVVSVAMELWILLTFVPRFYLIARRRHDTFE